MYLKFEVESPMKQNIQFVENEYLSSKKRYEDNVAKAKFYSEQTHPLYTEMMAWHTALSALKKREGIPESTVLEVSEVSREENGKPSASKFVGELMQSRNGQGLTYPDIAEALRINGYEVHKTYHYSIVENFKKKDLITTRGGKLFWNAKKEEQEKTAG